MKTRILFLLKKNNEYGHEYHEGIRSGLYNSVNMLKNELIRHFWEYVDIKVGICIDGNSIDKEVHDFRPHICLLEAIWFTPEKLQELVNLHPRVKFIVRIHSDIPFLANEGIAIDWIKQFAKIPGVIIAPNCTNAVRELQDALGINCLYLPNLYDETDLCHSFVSCKDVNHPNENLRLHREDILDVGCFGAIRPLKNQLLQAFIAMEYANKNGYVLRFHINGTRVEQWGENVRKNLRALFKDTKHILVEWPWLNRKEFLKVVSRMDLGLQLSHNESFNIVAADFVSQNVPIVVSETIYWMPDRLKIDNYNVDKTLEAIRFCLKNKKAIAKLQQNYLKQYNKKSLKQWAHI